MARCILSTLRSCGSTYHRAVAITSNSRSFCRTGDSKDGGANNKSTLGKTTIIVQQGCDIQELPVILRKIKKDEFVAICADKLAEPEAAVPAKSEEVKAEVVIPLLDKCKTTMGILSIIDQIPAEELSPEIAAHAFDRLIRNESLIGLKNLEDSNQVFEKMIQCILKNSEQKTLLDFMEVLKTFLDLQKTVQKFCDELLLRNSDGILSIVEICECIERFVDCKQQAAAEKFWTGISDKEKGIDDKNIKFIYRVLPKLKVSRRMLVGVLEQRITQLWWHLKPDAVAEIVVGVVKSQCSSHRTMQSLSRWLNTNIHAVNESNLETILRSFTALDFTNNEVERALERYIKAKGIKVTAQTLILAVLEHCEKFRLRNHHILNGCAEYLISHHEKISSSGIKSFISPFGYLNFQPLNSIRFWQVVEQYLNNNFNKISPQDLVGIFLNCCYLEMYPLNFIPSVFNPFFLDTIHTSTPPERLAQVRADLKLLDAALTLECENYLGPLLPRDHTAKSIWLDSRIKRMTNNISNHIEKIAGGLDNYTKSVIIGRLPTNSLYIVDVLIHPPGIANFWSYSIRNDKNIFVAVLIHLPEHFSSNGEFLVGPQVMRMRHLRRLGLKVVTLQHDMLAKLKMHPKQLDKYLVDRMKQALPALPEKGMLT